MSEATMTTKGQVTVPKAIRNLLHLKPGDRLEFQPAGEGTVILRPATRTIDQLFGFLHEPKRKPRSLRQMENAISRHHRQSR